MQKTHGDKYYKLILIEAGSKILIKKHYLIKNKEVPDWRPSGYKTVRE